MKVAIDSGPITGADSIRGIGFHTKELISKLQKTPDLELQALDFSQSDLKTFDIAHYPYFHPHFLTLPFSKPTPKVILTIHDLIRLIYPKAYPPGIKGTLRFQIQKHNLKNVDAIITISETSKKDILRFLPVSADKVHVIYLAAQTKPKKITKSLEVKSKYKLPDQFVLYVGDVNYNKNILGLTRACELANLPLVMVGKQAAQSDFDKSHVENLTWNVFWDKYANSSNILRVGFVPSEDLPAFYQLASVYCQPSFYEGFGLPILEAFSNKCPVVSSLTQALVEVADSAAIFVDPKNHKEMANALKLVSSNKTIAKDLIHKGTNRLERFSWERAANETAEVYKKVYLEK